LGIKQAKVEPAKQIESDFYTKDYETKILQGGLLKI